MTDPRYMRPGIDFARGKLIEELGELQAALGKSIRWGWLSSNPELPREQRETNADWVRREIADVRQALDNIEHEMTMSCIPKGLVFSGPPTSGSDSGGNSRSSFG